MLEAKHYKVIEEVEKPGNKEMMNYGLGFFGIILVWTLVGSFLTFYYTDIVGISATVVGTLMLVARLFDGITDISMGTIVDRTKSKHGKARPWIIWMSVPLAISTVLLFSVPDIGTTGKIVYAYATYILLILVYTGISIPYKTLLGLMTQDQQGRSMINVYTGVFTMSSTLLVMILAQPIASAIGGRLGWLVVAVFSGVIIVATSMIAFRSTKERVQSQSESKKDDIPLKLGLKALLTNKYWLIITTYCVVTYTVNALLTGAGLFYAIYVLGSGGLFSLISLALFIPSIICFFFIAKLIKRFGKRNIALTVSLIAVIGPIVKLIDPSNTTIFLTGTMIQGFSLIPVLTLLYAMINDTNEYGEWKNGFRTEGLINSAASFGMKVGTGIGGALIGWLLGFGGYVGAAAVQTELAITMIITLNIYLPLALCLLQVLLMWMYKLDRQYPIILAELKQRKA
ncbi:MFS transporter [Bacillus sp. FJAT-45037]|uniref:MFS transporter n=1 Tax=Bacillus sp. FJAT-45037 TaxID=2011007 RepID=UPI000C23E9F3|nr:glycoside-pentoside-hexuronide (GPH):cation symporter [Bacillus sp. FJAT-45037]